MKKYQTYDQLEATQAKAAHFARDVLQDDDLADDLEDESPESYAERKHVTITNVGRRTNTVANGNGSMTKDEMADCLDQVHDILTDVYTPETSREDAMAGIADALDVIEGGPTDDTDGDDVDDDDS